MWNHTHIQICMTLCISDKIRGYKLYDFISYLKNGVLNTWNTIPCDLYLPMFDTGLES